MNIKDLVNGKKYLIETEWDDVPIWTTYEAEENIFRYDDGTYVAGKDVEGIVEDDNEKYDRKISCFRDIMHKFEEQHRKKWVEVKDSLDKERVEMCIDWGGHFYGNIQEKTIKMVIGWRTEIYRECRVCRNRKLLESKCED